MSHCQRRESQIADSENTVVFLEVEVKICPHNMHKDTETEKGGGKRSTHRFLRDPSIYTILVTRSTTASKLCFLNTTLH